MSDQNNNSTLEKHHSRLGIASLMIGISVPVLLILFYSIAMLLGTKEGSIGGYILFGTFIFAIAAPALHLLGVIFGIIGWISKKTKNLFPVIGTILNSILGITGLLIGAFLLYLILTVGGLILH
jgi:hypothetical protein